jgi:CubicO group peptidase (beta-lactamase class C family)
MRPAGYLTLLIALTAVPRAAHADTRGPAVVDKGLLERGFTRAAALPRLQALVVAQHGVIVAEQRFRGPGLDAPVNIKSVSKSVISALVGIAIERGALKGVEQPIAPFFRRHVAAAADPRFRVITIGHLLSMQSGLVRTSGPNYGRWTRSRDWVAYVLRRPLASEPGGPMLYSTGNSHLLSAILTHATHRSTLSYARERLAKPIGIELRAWRRDPQGIYFGGNEMYMSAHDLLRFGELYRNAGRVGPLQVLPEAWVAESWTPRARSMFSGSLYGYGWFIAELQGRKLYYAWGYGGQFVFVFPELALTVVTTSDPSGPRDFEHLGEIYAVLRECIMPAVDPVLSAAGARC